MPCSRLATLLSIGLLIPVGCSQPIDQPVSLDASDDAPSRDMAGLGDGFPRGCYLVSSGGISADSACTITLTNRADGAYFRIDTVDQFPLMIQGTAELDSTMPAFATRAYAAAELAPSSAMIFYRGAGGDPWGGRLPDDTRLVFTAVEMRPGTTLQSPITHGTIDATLPPPDGLPANMAATIHVTF